MCVSRLRGDFGLTWCCYDRKNNVDCHEINNCFIYVCVTFWTCRLRGDFGLTWCCYARKHNVDGHEIQQFVCNSLELSSAHSYRTGMLVLHGVAMIGNTTLTVMKFYNYFDF